MKDIFKKGFSFTVLNKVNCDTFNSGVEYIFSFENSPITITLYKYNRRQNKFFIKYKCSSSNDDLGDVLSEKEYTNLYAQRIITLNDKIELL